MYMWEDQMPQYENLQPFPGINVGSINYVCIYRRMCVEEEGGGGV